MSHTVRADPGVSEDLQNLRRDQDHVPDDWRLSPVEVEDAIAQAVGLIKSLAADSFQGEPMRGSGRLKPLAGCRRLKFDPAEPSPRKADGRERRRMRLVWVNEPNEATIELVRVLAVTHRYNSWPYTRAAGRRGRTAE